MVKTKARKNGKSRFFYEGVFYPSSLEVRVAVLLDENEIPFTPHVMFEINGSNGNGGRREKEVDFVLKEWIKPYWSSNPIRAIEVKGRLNLSDWERRRELEAINMPTFIATGPIIDFWEREQFIEYKVDEMQPAGRFKQDNKRNNNKGNNGGEN